MKFLYFLISVLFFQQSISMERPPLPAATLALLDSFVETYWSGSNWKGASTWTGDNASRLMVNYLAFLGSRHHDKTNDILVAIITRSLNRTTILQYLTQGYDDFGWTIFCLLEILRYTDQFEERYPTSDLVPRLPLLRKRLACRAAFLHDILKDSWTTEFCGGGSEWKVRARRKTLWPSVDFGGVYKNTITNHLYISNNAQIYNASSESPRPIEITEWSLFYFRWIWKSIRPAFGWPRSQLKPFNFTDIDLIHRAKEGLEWMAQAQLLTNESLYIDGKRLRFLQNAPVERVRLICDASVKRIYTYNQLAGIRAHRYISRVTGDPQSIESGHRAIQNLIKSTYTGTLGTKGTLEDTCDRFGNCSQDMQIFKGLALLDIKNYCEPIHWLHAGLQEAHRSNCSAYHPWVNGNAAAAYATLDPFGRFGGYWNTQRTNHSRVKVRSIEVQIAGLSALLTSSWFDETFGSLQ
jgi:hypothetical protein